MGELCAHFLHLFFVATDLAHLTLHFQLGGDRHTHSPGKRESWNREKIFMFSLNTFGITMGPIYLVSLKQASLFICTEAILLTK